MFRRPIFLQIIHLDFNFFKDLQIIGHFFVIIQKIKPFIEPQTRQYAPVFAGMLNNC